MPEICRFKGIRILMYAGSKEHPPPHFHAEHGDDEAQICIQTGRVIKGRLKSASMKLIRGWLVAHKAELEENWNLARDDRELNSIPPP